MIEYKIIAALTPIFGNNIFPNVAPQHIPQNDAAPFAVYTVVFQQPTAVNACGDMLNNVAVQVDIYTVEQAVNVALNRAELSARAVERMTAAGFVFKQSRQGFDGTIRLFRNSIDFEIVI